MAEGHAGQTEHRRCRKSGKNMGKDISATGNSMPKGRVKKGYGAAAFLVVGKQDTKGGVSGSITSELDRNQRMEHYSGMTAVWTSSPRS